MDIHVIARKYLNIGPQRLGQAYMNALHDINPKLSQEITNTEIDCYYFDSRLPLMLEKFYSTRTEG